MDIATQAELLLRDAGYESWQLTIASPPVLCFESATIIGFLHVFDTAAQLIDNWAAAQNLVLSRYAANLRHAGEKAWNVYSVFLTSERNADKRRQVERLEEDFTLTRKIARTNLQLPEDVKVALMPLLPIRAQPTLSFDNVEDRLRARTKDVPTLALEGFLRGASAEEIAEMLRIGR
jgi:hypothetical protein